VGNDLTMIPPESPCRLFVYLAREAPLGVVLRRGPSDWVRLSLWRTDTDEFEHGQWMSGRLYERRADVSADGSLFVYFARRASGPSQEGRDTWVAVSRPPFFTALALWFVGGTYHTGGFFPARRSIWPGFGAGPPDQGEVPIWLKPAGNLPPYVDRTHNWTDRTVWMNRLLRDGWERVPEERPETWRRLDPSGRSWLEMTIRSEADFAAYGGPFVVEYALVPVSGDEILPLGLATWADWDQRGRLVVAREGCLWAVRAPGETVPIADFNAQTPDPVPSPDWAKTWPDPPDHASPRHA
jgi:hypothetical protein